MVKQLVVHPYYGILLNNLKKNELLIHTKTWIARALPIVGVHVYKFWIWQNYRNGEQISGYQRLRRGGSGRIVSVDIKGQHEGFLGWWNLGCINASILVMILHYSFARCYLWGKMDQRYVGSLCIISCNCMWIYNYLKIKSLIFSK